MPVFQPDITFDYDLVRKRNFALASILSGILLLAIIMYFFFFLRDSNNLFIREVGEFISYITGEIKSASLLGSFYAALFGGLFFVVIPTEAVFLVFLRADNPPLLLIPIYIFGFVFSYSFNYFAGMKLREISKKVITPKKFYKIKGVLNRYGSLAIFGFNALPLPSQPLATILGVFKYNKTRFYVMFILGQLTKYVVMTAGFYLVRF